MEFKKLLVCVDGSRASLAAAALAVEWAAEVRAVNVLEPAGPAEPAATGLAKPEAPPAARLEESARALLARVSDIGARAGVRITQALLAGVPSEAILEDARLWQPDLIVMGRSDRRGTGRALLGSEVERVLEFAEQPVLVVPSLAG